MNATTVSSTRLAERLLSTAILALVIFQIYQSTKVGTTPRGTPAREALQHLHISVGLLALLVALPRLWLWWRAPRPERPASVPYPADAFARTICLLFLLTVVAFGITGPLFAWSEGHRVSIFDVVTIPPLIAPGYRAQVLLGYLHSTLGFWILYLTALAIVVSVWQRIRYRAPLLRMLPWASWQGGAQ